MGLDKLRGLHRLGSSFINRAYIRSGSHVSGSSAETWTEGGRTHYRYSGAATYQFDVDFDPYYTKRNRNRRPIIGVTTVGQSTIDYLTVGGGGGGGSLHPSGAPLGAGGGGGGGGVNGFYPTLPTPLRQPAALSVVPPNSVASVVGAVRVHSYNPLNDITVAGGRLTYSIGGGAGTDATGTPSSIVYNGTTFFNNPTLGIATAIGGGRGGWAGGTSSGGPGGSGGGGAGYVAGGAGIGTVGQGSDGGAGGGSGPGPAPAPGPGGQGGGGGGVSGVGGVGNFPSSSGTGGNGVTININSVSTVLGGGGGGAGRNGVPGPPHGTSFPGRPNASGGTGGGPGGGASAPTTNSYGGGGGGGLSGSGGTGAPGTVIVSF